MHGRGCRVLSNTEVPDSVVEPLLTYNLAANKPQSTLVPMTVSLLIVNEVEEILVMVADVPVRVVIVAEVDCN